MANSHPYLLDSNQLVHKTRDCPNVDTITGDANKDGVIRGIAENDEIPCPHCVLGNERNELLKDAVSYIEHLM